MDTIHIAFIMDDNFALCTGVAITSLIHNRQADTHYAIHILCDGVSEENRNALAQLAGDGVEIDIRRMSPNTLYSSMTIEGLHVTSSALFKFNLPELFPDLDRILYLDGDILILKDLAALYHTDISGYYLAAVSDVSVSLWKGKTFSERLGIEHGQYFNSGVMLLNLRECRLDSITEKLIAYRRDGVNDFMDQDALNVVLGEKTLYLSLLYNTMASVIAYADLKHLRSWYPQEPLSSNDWMENATIYHFSSPSKPWKYSNVPYQQAWQRYFEASPFASTRLSLELWNPEELERDAQMRKAIGENRENALVSVIMPVYNSQKHLKAALDSLFVQNVFPLLEVIVIDDGSTDISQMIYYHYRHDPRFVLAEQSNLGPGVARNLGMALAKGKYITFLDSDDILVAKTLKMAYEKAEETQADIVQCNADSINEHGQNRGGIGFLQKKLLPEAPVYSRRELGIHLFLFTTGAVWGRLYRKDFLRRHNLTFPALRRSEDFFFTDMALFKAERITTLDEPLIHYRRDSDGTSLESTKHQAPMAFWDGCRLLLDALHAEQADAVTIASVKFKILVGIKYNLSRVTTLEAFKEIYDHLPEMLAYLAVTKEELDMLDPPNRRKMAECLAYPQHSCTELLFAFYQNALANNERIKLRYYTLQHTKIPALEKKHKKELNTLRSSWSYRIGRGITFLPRKVRGVVGRIQKHGLQAAVRHYLRRFFR